MTKSAFHVIIIGGGLGGLTLAQGLKKEGVSCAVYEKDMSRADRLQGYRIVPPLNDLDLLKNLHDFGTEGLKACLPGDLYELIAKTAGQKTEGTMSMMTERLDTLLKVKFRADSDHFAMSRIVLHRILANGLDDVVHYGHRFDRAETLESGRIRVHFTNASFVDGDLVVAADGVRSAVRKQFLPDSLTPYPFGVDGIVGKIFLDDEGALNDLDFLRRGVCLAASTNAKAMFIAPQIYSDSTKFEIKRLFAGVQGVTHESQLSPNATGDDLLLLDGGDKKELIDDARDYVFYAFLSRHSDILPNLSRPRFVTGTSQQELLDGVVGELQQHAWAPQLIDLVKKTDVNTLGYWPLHVSPAVDDLSQYKPYNVTFLGGEGGNTALRDAGVLSRHLAKFASAQDIKTAMLTEIPKYEKDILDFSRVVVNKSYRMAKMATMEGYVFPYLIRAFLRIVHFFVGEKN